MPQAPRASLQAVGPAIIVAVAHSDEEGEAALPHSVDRAGLILLVFPLYADAVPFLVTKALAVIANHRRASGRPTPQRLVAIVNSGFPETRQNAVALAFCQEFASRSARAGAAGSP